MLYLVEVQVGDWLGGTVPVEADNPEDARAEAEEKVRSASVEAVRVWECGGEEVT